MRKHKLFWILVVATVIKLLGLFLFTSGYQQELFLPFIRYFNETLKDPWLHFLAIQPDAFPYPPLMLYITALFHLPSFLFSSCPLFVEGIFVKLPIVLADAILFYLLLRMYPRRKYEVSVFYYANPIVIYASYFHSQFDLIPTSVLFYSVYLLLRARPVLSAVLFGFSLSIKFHVVLVLPLFIIYLLKRRQIRDCFYFLVIPAIIHMFFVFPFYSQAYVSMVVANARQVSVFDSYYEVSSLKIYLPVLFTVILYIKSFSFRKINDELLLILMALVFSIFVLLIKPGPAWYIWFTPFMCIPFIKYYRRRAYLLRLFFVLSVFYLLYFIIFHPSDYQRLVFLNTPLKLALWGERVVNLSYSILEAILLSCVYLIYLIGIKSNRLYSRNQSVLIGISGDSATGKTSIMADLQGIIGKSMIKLEGDGDHRWERGDENWSKYTHLDPKANYLHRQSEDLVALKYGKRVSRLEYCHSDGKFQRLPEIGRSDFVVISGLHTLYLPQMRKLLDLKIFLSPEEELRRYWKVARDQVERGYEKRDVLKQIESRLVDSQKYICPQKKYADLIIEYFSQNDFSIDSTDKPELGLRLTLNSNIHLENIILSLRDNGLDVFHDYSEDLEKQTISLEKPPSGTILETIMRNELMNIDEILDIDVRLEDGFKGFVQLVCLIMIDDIMRGYQDEV